MGFVAPVIGAIGSAAGAIGSAVASGVGALAGGVGSVVGGLGSALASGAGALGSAVASGVGSLASGASSLVSGLFGSGVPAASSVPMAASGGPATGVVGMSAGQAAAALQNPAIMSAATGATTSAATGSTLGGLFSSGASTLGNVASSLIGGSQQTQQALQEQGVTGSSGGGLLGMGNFLSTLIPVAAGLATDQSGQLDVENINLMTPEQSEFLRVLSNAATAEIQKTPEAYQGQLTADPSTLQQAIFDVANLPALQAAVGSPILQDLFGRVGQNINEFAPTPQQAALQASGVFEQAVADPARRALMEQQLPALQEQFIGQDALRSSAFNRAFSQAVTGLERDLAGQRAGFVDARQQQALQNMLSVGQLGQQQLQSPGTQLDALVKAALLGSEQRNITQSGLTNQYQEFLRLNQLPNPVLAGLLGAPLSSSQFQPVAQQQGSGPFSGLLSGIGEQLGQSIFGNNSLGSIFA